MFKRVFSPQSKSAAVCVLRFFPALPNQKTRVRQPAPGHGFGGRFAG